MSNLPGTILNNETKTHHMEALNYDYILENVERVYYKATDMRGFNRSGKWKVDIAGKQKEIADKLRPFVTRLEACPVCTGKEHKLLVEIHRYPYHICNSCGHVFSLTPPATEAIKGLYINEGDQVQSVQGEIYVQKELYASRVERIAFPKAEFIDKRAGEKRGKWIDIGAGVGDLVVSATRLGWEAIGIESDENETTFAKAMGANVKRVFLTSENMAENVKDAHVISLINILEHIADTVGFLQSIAGHLNPGTKVAIEVPRHPSISSLSNIAFPMLAARHIYPPDHLHIFSERSMELMLEKCNLKPEAIWLFGQDIHEKLNSMAAKADLDNHPLLEKIYSIAGELQRVVDNHCLSDTMLLVARKI